MKNSTMTIKSIHFWIITIVMICLVFIYQLWPWRDFYFTGNFGRWFSWLEPLFELAFIEFRVHFMGILFWIPIIYAAIVLSWHYTWIFSFVAVFALLPSFIGFWHIDMAIVNTVFILLPAFITSIPILYLELRRRDRIVFIEKEQARRLYALKLLETQDMERKRLAEELHDDTIQTLLAIASYADVIEYDKVKNSSEMKKRLAWIRKNLLDSVDRLRKLSLELRPDVLDQMGLLPGLKWLVGQYKKNNVVDISLKVTGNIRQLPHATEVTTFRIIQEALNNIRRHARATKINVMLCFDFDMLKIKITDNGCGFSQPESLTGLVKKNKLGLIGMLERAKSINGRLKIDSKPDQGTTVNLDIPLGSDYDASLTKKDESPVIQIESGVKAF